MGATGFGRVLSALRSGGGASRFQSEELQRIDVRAVIRLCPEHLEPDGHRHRIAIDVWSPDQLLESEWRMAFFTTGAVVGEATPVGSKHLFPPGRRNL